MLASGHIAFALYLVCAAGGLVILSQEKKKPLLKAAGLVLIIGAVLGTACLTYKMYEGRSCHHKRYKMGWHHPVMQPMHDLNIMLPSGHPPIDDNDFENAEPIPVEPVAPTQ